MIAHDASGTEIEQDTTQPRLLTDEEIALVVGGLGPNIDPNG